MMYPVFWANEAQIFWKTSGMVLIPLFLVLSVLLVVAFRLRRIAITSSDEAQAQTTWMLYARFIVIRSLPLLATVMILLVFIHWHDTNLTIPLLDSIFSIILLGLLVRWVRDFLRIGTLTQNAPPALLVNHCRAFLFFIFCFGVAYTVLGYFLNSTSVILLSGRLILEFVFFIWVFILGKIIKTTPPLFVRDEKKRELVKMIVIGLFYTLSIAALVLELSGFGQMSLYWLVSWGRTFIVVAWVGILLKILLELEEQLKETSPTDKDGVAGTGQVVARLAVRLGMISWFIGIFVLLMIAWGAKSKVILGFFKIFNYQIPASGFSLSLAGIFYAVIILFATHALTSLIGTILKKRLLEPSGMAIGVQESIVTITKYFFWIIGMLMVLRAIGVQSTSLAVAFGGLGIGLGFGLQNIFNNFISGLILLFERPIQVGDVIELNNIWGTVTKINVRSTVIQTFDNSSMIIPNSDFISKQVTNWSFKDLRLRRDIRIGVAYGSDIELVRSILLKIAQSHPRVIKDPEPDVVFSDFGDSALIFLLRIWSLIDDSILPLGPI